MNWLHPLKPTKFTLAVSNARPATSHHGRKGKPVLFRGKKYASLTQASLITGVSIFVVYRDAIKL